ncbi:MAG: class I SAM-dependent methyltransferase [Candidatus Woesearchaeota archaeon]|jgi:2-polyprenyl-3-methyl-5-hydroxy-6-metoxy-1,4-benzoquinol methylase
MKQIKKNINTQKYWNNIFKKEKFGIGREFLYSSVAKFIKDENNKYKNKQSHILDIGCALGHGTIRIQEVLKNSLVDACDFSDVAIKKAKNNYKNINFFVHDVNKDKLTNNYDMIVMIETLEHLDNPIKAVKKYLKCCKQMIIVTPYDERNDENKEISAEHTHSFDEFTFSKIKEFKKFSIFKIPNTNLNMIIYFFS